MNDRPRHHRQRHLNAFKTYKKILEFAFCMALPAHLRHGFCQYHPPFQISA